MRTRSMWVNERAGGEGRKRPIRYRSFDSVRGRGRAESDENEVEVQEEDDVRDGRSEVGNRDA